MAQIQDFGCKIGGARKDTWKREGLSVADLYGMTSAEKKKYIKRDYIWPKPDMKDQMEKECRVSYASGRMKCEKQCVQLTQVNYLRKIMWKLSAVLKRW